MAPARMISVSIRDIEQNSVKRKQIKNSTTISELKEEIKRLFSLGEVQTIMFQGIDLRDGTLETNGIDDNCLIEILGQVVGS
jgi:hypothetical protein